MRRLNQLSWALEGVLLYNGSDLHGRRSLTGLTILGLQGICAENIGFLVIHVSR